MVEGVWYDIFLFYRIFSFMLERIFLLGVNLSNFFYFLIGKGEVGLRNNSKGY